MRKTEHTAYEAALLYYFQGETMEAIARRLGVSRSTVSRLLSEARETGVVKISLQDPGTTPESLSSDLGHEFGVRVHLVSVRESDTEVRRLDLVARVAARLVASWMEPGTVLGIAWGTTIAAVTQHLTPHPCPESAVVQLNGAANANTSGVNHAGAIIAAAATAFDASMHHFPVPAFFDYTTTKKPCGESARYAGCSPCNAGLTWRCSESVPWPVAWRRTSTQRAIWTTRTWRRCVGRRSSVTSAR